MERDWLSEEWFRNTTGYPRSRRSSPCLSWLGLLKTLPTCRGRGSFCACLTSLYTGFAGRLSPILLSPKMTGLYDIRGQEWSQRLVSAAASISGSFRK